jgi:hypothetical protein
VNALGVASVVGRETDGRLEITATGAGESGRIVFGDDEKFTSLGDGTVDSGNVRLEAHDDIEFGDVVVNGDLDVLGGGTADIILNTRDAGPVLTANGVVVTDQGMDVVARGRIRIAGYDTITPMDLENRRNADPQFASLTPRKISTFLLNNYLIRTLLDEGFPGLTRGTTVLDARSEGPLFGLGNKLRRTLASRTRLPGTPSAVRPDGLPVSLVNARVPRLVEAQRERYGVRSDRAENLTDLFSEYFSDRTWSMTHTNSWFLFLEATGREELKGQYEPPAEDEDEEAEQDQEGAEPTEQPQQPTDQQETGDATEADEDQQEVTGTDGEASGPAPEGETDSSVIEVVNPFDGDQDEAEGDGEGVTTGDRPGEGDYNPDYEQVIDWEEASDE